MAMIPWRTRLRRKRSVEGVQELIPDAEQWATCAVAERRRQLEGVGCKFNGLAFDGADWTDYHAPQNRHIQRLGLQFATAIDIGDKKRALIILDKLDKWIARRTD